MRLFTATVSLFLASAVCAYDNVKMLCLVNKERAKSGLQPLGLDPKLTQAAQQHSDDQAKHSNMSHDGSNGSNPGERITETGFQWRAYGENVAYGYRDEEKCMQQWMNSPGHRANILSSKVTKFGSAVAYNSRNVPYYTQEFGKDAQPATDIPKCDGSDSYGDNSYSGKKETGQETGEEKKEIGGYEKEIGGEKKETTRSWRWKSRGGYVEVSGYVPEEVLAVLRKYKGL